ncbi:hypothetical protein G6F37_012052 [Rhizopus arrhizus]|nr:hypothetical protein G6F38_012229 [Rhizopus arrhizus]KAG1145974.1 hypothetical protein G6F37_012052 [Rhizopus arrhizus]
MEHVNHSELATTLANLYNMVHQLTNQVTQLVHKFDSLESANPLLKSELDRMTAIVNKLSASNTAAQSRSNDSALVTANDKTAMENLGTEASCYASRPISSNTETEIWTTIVKKAPRRGVVTSVRRRIAIARAFSIPSSEFVGYETIYILRYRRLNRAEIRRRFNHLGFDTTRIIDISFPARTAIGLLAHQAFKPELIKTLQDCRIEIISSFSPVAPEHIADPKFNQCTTAERTRLGQAMHQDRCIRTLRFIRPHLVVSIARYFTDQNWISSALATDIIRARVPQP